MPKRPERQRRRRDDLTWTVEHTDTAARFDPDLPEAASTPFVLALAEIASHRLLQPELEPGQISVGMRADVEHLIPSRVGAKLRADARLIRRVRARRYFRIEVWDGEQLAARIGHVRAVVDASKINARL